MAISKEGARGLRNLALRYKFVQMQHPAVIVLPEEPIEEPSVWVVMEDGGASPGGSFLRFSRGTRITDPTEAMILKESGLHLEAVA